MRYIAVAVFSIVALCSLALLAFLNPVPSRWCIEGNGCLFYRDNLWATMWIGLPALGIAVSSTLGARFAYRGSRHAVTLGTLLLVLLLPIGWIAFLMANNKWQ